MPKRRDAGDYPSPYTALLEVDGAMFVITRRETAGFYAVRLTPEERDLAIRALDDAHADVEARIVGARRKAGR